MIGSTVPYQHLGEAPATDYFPVRVQHRYRVIATALARPELSRADAQ
jgi:hypothetical protein